MMNLALVHNTVNYQCKRCGEYKPATAEFFYQRKSGRISTPCRQCHLKRMKELNDKNKDERNSLRRKEYKANPQKFTDQQRKQKFGLTRSMYEALLAAQGGGCGICGKKNNVPHPRTKGKQLLSVDHCHETQKIRGILCSSCNMGIGFFQDSNELLLKAALYLQRTR